MVFKVKQNFLKTWLCIPCEQSGRNRGIPSDLSDKCKLQSCRKSEKKREKKFEKKIVFFFSFINFWLWHDKKICPSVVVKYRKVFGCVMWTHSLEIVIFYTEILTGKVVMWCFFSSKMSEKIHNSTFQVKILV